VVLCLQMSIQVLLHWELIQVALYLQTLVQVQLHRELIQLEFYLHTMIQVAMHGAHATEMQCVKFVLRLLCFGLADVFGYTGGATPRIAFEWLYVSS